MLTALVAAAVLVAITVAVHAAGLALVLRHVMKRGGALPADVWPFTWLLIRIAWWLLLLHGIEVSVWALFYAGSGCLPDAETAFYFSGVTYATIGYGDVLLPRPWRILAPIEGLTGILMCGLSAAFLVALVSRIYALRWRAQPGES